MKKILYAKPSITQKEIDYVTDAISNGWGEKCYEYINKFENIFNTYIEAKQSFATSSCTGALHMTLAAMGVGFSDEVIVPDITWSASVVPITYLGAKPVFVDVLQDTWCINPEKIEKAITKKTKAIIAVHLYGNLAEMIEINNIAKKHNLYVIEDAAEALGSEYFGKKTGSIGDAGVFSFHGTKTITTGEGGMITLNNEKLIEKIKILSNHGRNPKEKRMFWVEEIGYKYKISNLQAALGFGQMERVEELVEKKRKIFNCYQNNFSNINEIALNPEKSNTKNSYWMPTIIFSKSLNLNRADFIQYMKEKGMDIRNFFYPNSMFPMFKKAENNIVSYEIYDRGINLPAYFDMTNDEIEYVSENIINYLKKNRNERQRN